MIRVGIVEDNIEIREGLTEILNASDGFMCRGAFSSAEDAIAKLVGKETDVVVRDIHLPGINGIACVRALRQKFPHLQFLMFTIDDEDAQVFDAIKAGAAGYILKSAPPANMLDVVKEVHQGARP